MNSVSVCYEQFQLLELSHFKICIHFVKLPSCVPQSA